ncbi:hypothetical protein [Providencia rettgeri]|uniref:hypothetical protein n=1 Tax=Providencia rettgeri TaxID=587 RepID=UPI00235ED2ED|nr:hypothetical protein [Providencia rettgeri]
MSKSDYLILKGFAKSGAWVKVGFPNAFEGGHDVRIGYVEAEKIADSLGVMERCNYIFTPMLEVKWLQEDGSLIKAKRAVHFRKVLEFMKSVPSENGKPTTKVRYHESPKIRSGC